MAKVESSSVESILKRALEWRLALSAFKETEALRIFYGPGESDHPHLKHLAIDGFKNAAWITLWQKVPEAVLESVRSVLVESAHLPFKIETISIMDRSQVASEEEVSLLWGKARNERFEVKEFGVPYLVQFHETKHPGLFLDHAPLRKWLLETQKGKRVLNLFAYTGSLSVAAGIGGAKHVTTLDLSKPTTEWGEENWKNAGLDPQSGNFIFGDVFEWLPRLIRKTEKAEQQKFDTILCDPPSFSRTKSGTFSTAKDTIRLHELILPLLADQGILVTSINSENIPEHQFLRDITSAAERCRISLRVLKRVDLPESFPTHSAKLTERYLKGFYLLREG